MGDIADDAIDGTACCLCGCYYHDPKTLDLFTHEYPCVCWSCWEALDKKERGAAQRALVPTLDEIDTARGKNIMSDGLPYDLDDDEEYQRIKAAGIWAAYAKGERSVDEFLIGSAVNMGALMAHIDALVRRKQLPEEAREETITYLRRYVEDHRD